MNEGSKNDRGAGKHPEPAPSAGASPPSVTPEAILSSLYEGNRRFASGQPSHEGCDLHRLGQVAPRQTPAVAVLGCADSRVPVELVFDQGFGDVFVSRLAGNIASPEAIASLEFGTAVLGAKVLMVLGHTSCGAVSATMKGEAVPGQISTLFAPIRPAIRASGGDLALAVVENVRNQAILLAEASPVIAGLVREGKLIVVGGVFDLATGLVEPVEV